MASFERRPSQEQHCVESPRLFSEADNRALLARLEDQNEEVSRLKEEVKRLEQDNVTLLDELDKVSSESTEEKRIRVTAEERIPILEQELESLRRRCQELSSSSVDTNVSNN